MTFLKHFQAELRPSTKKRRIVVQDNHPVFDKWAMPNIHTTDVELVNLELTHDSLKQLENEWNEYQQLKDFLRKYPQSSYEYDQYRIIKELSK